jgi:hypothetical protein
MITPLRFYEAQVMSYRHDTTPNEGHL